MQTLLGQVRARALAGRLAHRALLTTLFWPIALLLFPAAYLAAQLACRRALGPAD